MKIDISNIAKIDGASLDIEFNEPMGELNSIFDDVTFNSPVVFNGSISNVHGVLKMKGRLVAQYTLKCSRCLKDINGKLDIGIKEDFVNGEKNEDSDTHVYEGNYIIVDETLKDNIILSMPMRQVCTENCKGLCTKCGANHNESTCKCEEEAINPQMEVLKNYFKI